MANATARRNEAEKLDLQDEIDERVLRLRDLTIFIYSPACSDEQLKAFTKTYGRISDEIDGLQYKLSKLSK